jgi:hypothetical protein
MGVEDTVHDFTALLVEFEMSVRRQRMHSELLIEACLFNKVLGLGIGVGVGTGASSILLAFRFFVFVFSHTI